MSSCHVRVAGPTGGGRLIARPPPGRADRGSATVLGLGAILLLLSLLLGFLVVGAAVRASLLARGAADSAALAGSVELLEGADTATACGAAADLAAANGADVVACGPDGGADAQVMARLRVEVAVPVPGLGGVRAHATARAGAVPVP